MSPETSNRPRIGIPWRMLSEESSGFRVKLDYYAESVRKAGAEPVEVSLQQPRDKLLSQMIELDGFVLPGSPADLDPKQYGAVNTGNSEAADEAREQTDRTILQHALAEPKPVLAICYGCQLLNVYLGGSLMQDLRSETGTTTAHRKKDQTPEPNDDPRHSVRLEPGSRLAALVGGAEAEINSSHHQAIAKLGQNLRITAKAPDGIIEGVEWTGDSGWVVGVQWHPERMTGDQFAAALFRDFVAAARRVHERVTQKV
jgi:putative glutamine amidotransferase